MRAPRLPVLPLLVLLATLLFAAMGLLVPFDGYDDGQVPIPQPDPPVQPAGWAFSIWGVIFASLAASAAFGLLRRPRDPGWDRARPPLLLSLLLGAAWLPVARASAVWATLLLVAMALLAILALLRTPRADRWLLLAPTALLAGWLTAAAFVSAGSALGGWGVLAPLPAAFLMLPLAGLAAAAVQALRPDAPEYGLAAAWALFGIAAKDATPPALAALAAAGVLLLLASWGIARRRAFPARR